MVIGLYRAGTSVVHRCPAWLALLLLAVGTGALVAFRSPAAVLVGAVVCVAGYLLAGLGLRALWTSVWSLRLIVVLLVVAAVKIEPDTAGGLDGAVSALIALPAGPILAFLVGLGFLAYGVFTVFRARYARLDV